MLIGKTMDLNQLAERLGTEATLEDARLMRDALIASDLAGHDTAEIGEVQWSAIMDKCFCE